MAPALVLGPTLLKDTRGDGNRVNDVV